ncbi:MAG: family 43 glycosylhydrolase, partial [Tepidisphaeraceae bacterium]
MRRIARIALAWSLTVAASTAVAQTWYPVPLPPKVKETKVILPASRDYNAPGGLPVRKLFDYGTRDPHVMLAPDGMYYMVATAFANTLPAPVKSRPDANGWWYNDGIPLWRSKDMIHWETLGYVWTLDHDATWAKAFKQSPHTERPDKAGLRAVWAPEIHYFKGTYWMPYAMNYDGIGVLKSTSGKPEGPYVDIKTDGPLVDDAIDASLFEDTDGKIYLLWNGYQIARMKDDVSGLAEAPRKLDFDPPPPWGEGINMQKINGKYVFTNAGVMPTVWHGRKENTYDCFSATADTVYGPYTGRIRAIPHDGHQDLFQDKQGNWWSSYFGSGPVAPWGIEPGVLPVTIDANGRLSPKRSYPRPEWRYTTSAPPDAW